MPDNNGGKPIQISGSQIFQPGQLSAEQIFPVEISFSGKAKPQTYPDGSTGAAFPDFRVTVTNLESGEAFEFVSTGHNRTTIMDDGTIVTVANGRNVVADPVGTGGIPDNLNLGDGTGVFLTAGTFRFAFAPDDDGIDNNGDGIIDNEFKLVEPLNGNGQMINVIDMFL